MKEARFPGEKPDAPPVSWPFVRLAGPAGASVTVSWAAPADSTAFGR
jgi:hypothetical protein